MSFVGIQNIKIIVNAWRDPISAGVVPAPRILESKPQSKIGLIRHNRNGSQDDAGMGCGGLTSEVCWIALT
jgi:hypothetical protein